MKRCTRCGLEKAESEYYKRYVKNEVTIYRPQCISCMNELSKENHQERKEKGLHANAALKREYRLNINQYEALYKKQQGRCAICKTSSSPKGNRFYVDHDHATGKVRGLLCASCNSGLGMFKDSLDLLQEAQSYLLNPIMDESIAAISEPDTIDRATKIENAKQEGRYASGIRNAKSKLTEDDVRGILASNLPARVVAETYKIDRTTVHNIRKGKTWRHIWAEAKH